MGTPLLGFEAQWEMCDVGRKPRALLHLRGTLKDLSSIYLNIYIYIYIYIYHIVFIHLLKDSYYFHILVVGNMQITPPLWKKVKKNERTS